MLMQNTIRLEASALGLEALVLGPLTQAKSLLVMLHGYGADAQDLMHLAHMLLAGREQQVAAISLQAPERLPPPHPGRQWFALPDLKPQTLDAGVAKARPLVSEALKRLWSMSGVRAEQTLLLGFSQGGMIALEVGLRMPQPLGQLVCLSGLLAGCERLAKEKAGQTPPVLMVHGEADGVVPFAAMQSSAQVLTALGVSVEAHGRPGLGHSIDAFAVEQIGVQLDRLSAGMLD